MASKKRWKPKGDMQRLSSLVSGIHQVPCFLLGGSGGCGKQVEKSDPLGYDMVCIGYALQYFD